MRSRPRIALAAIALALAAPSAGADEPLAYTARAASQAWIGTQSVLTAPLDPLAETLWPPEEFEEVPGVPVTNRVLGAGTGLLLGGYRLLMGLTDLVLAPLPMLAVSPPLRFSLTPGLVQERESDPEWICDLDGWGEEPRSWAHRLGLVTCFPWSKGSAGTETDEG